MPDKTGRLHLFSSVKGGSAKTSTALCYAHELSLQYKHTYTDKTGETITVYPKVVVIDADVRGTSMETVLLGTAERVGKEPRSGDVNEFYLRDTDNNFDDYGNRKYYTSAIIGIKMPTQIILEDGFITQVAQTNSPDGEFYVALASQSQGSRDRFVTASGRGDGAAVSTAYFKTCFKTLLDSLDRMKWEDDDTVGTDFIVVDMPTSQDEYARCIIEMCLSEYKDKKVKSTRLENINRTEMKDGKQVEKEYKDLLLKTWEPTLHLMTLPVVHNFDPTVDYLQTVMGSTRTITNHMDRVVLTIVDSYDILKHTDLYRGKTKDNFKDKDDTFLGKINKSVGKLEEQITKWRDDAKKTGLNIEFKMRLIPYLDAYKDYSLLVSGTHMLNSILENYHEVVLDDNNNYQIEANLSYDFLEP